MQATREDNPFEEELIAKEWINSVENEKGLIRDSELYPMLARWVTRTKPEILVEIGSGQGICSTKLGDFTGQYIGVEPSAPLVKRAQELYGSDTHKQFLVGNAYDLPMRNSSADAAFSVNVWFHLEDLETASTELSRILKPGGNLLIITSNPNKNKVWESMFSGHKKEGKKLDGRVKVPVNDLSRNVLFLHELSEMTDALAKAGITDVSTKTFGITSEDVDEGLFVAIKGTKSDS